MFNNPMKTDKSDGLKSCVYKNKLAETKTNYHNHKHVVRAGH